MCTGFVIGSHRDWHGVDVVVLWGDEQETSVYSFN